MAQTHDDAFHEIQLNGKQLVFLFMAATVASVVIFLCGVMVGRGVRAERAALSAAVVVDEAPHADPSPAVVTPPAPAEEQAATIDPRTPPPQPVDDLSYPRQLDQKNPPAARLEPPPTAAVARPVVAAPAAAKPAAEKPAPEKQAPVPAPAKPAAVAAAAPPPAPTREDAPAPGAGFTVQVAALNVRSEADAIAKRLTSKGYSAYVQTPGGSASVFRVRVGSFKTRREAETLATRLQREEQFKPWVTR